MKLFDWLFGANLTYWDERAIGRGIRLGDTMKDIMLARWEAIKNAEREQWQKEYAPKLEAARAYNKSFMKINREAEQRISGIGKSPMNRPSMLSPHQRELLIEFIDDYAAKEEIPAAHAARMKEYLQWAFEIRDPT